MQISATRHQTRAAGNAESRGLRWVVRPHLSIPSPESTIRRSARLPLGTRVFHAMVTSRSHRGSRVACIRFTAKLMVSTSSKDVGAQYNSRVRILLVYSSMAHTCSIPLPRSPLPPAVAFPASRTIYKTEQSMTTMVRRRVVLFIPRLGLLDGAAAPESMPSTTRWKRGSTCLR